MIRRFIFLAFPIPCLLCYHSSGDYLICKHCELLLPWIQYGCDICSKPLAATNTKICTECAITPPVFSKVQCLFEYKNPIQRWIYRFKYRSSILFARLFAQWMIRHFTVQDFNFDWIVPVPVHRIKLQSRGFNQCDIMAKIIATKLCIPYSKKILIKQKHTPPQAELNKKNRKKNIKNAFRVTTPLNNKRILVIEDVITTASTVSEIAKTLQNAGATWIEIWTIARA